MELMASSDNVLRGGLTPKSIDTVELLRIVSYVDGRPQILSGRETGRGVHAYDTPADEFLLERVELSAGSRLQTSAPHSVECLIVIEGSAVMEGGGDLSSDGVALPLERGRAVLIPASIPYQLRIDSPHALLFRARVPGPRF